MALTTKELLQARATRKLTDDEQWLLDARLGHIYISGYKAAEYPGAPEHPVDQVKGSRSSADPGHDVDLMTSFIELENAARLRGVAFAPYALGGVVLVSPHAPMIVIVRGLWKAMQLAKRRTGVRRWWQVI